MLTRRIYWRRASIQDGQAPGDATVLKRFFRDNLIIFRRISKRIALVNQWISPRVSIIQIFNFPDVTWPLFGTLRGLYLPNAWSQTLQTSKRHTFRVSAFNRYHWFGGKTVSCRLCAGQWKGIGFERYRYWAILASIAIGRYCFQYSHAILSQSL